ncbi:MAG: hypothetical protein U9Q82_04745 [Chloroflexota bacterium]|nr:hypothetical protein [Chloroflexota bacterium]
MINRQNYKLVEEYLRYRRTEVKENSIKIYRTHLIQLLEFSDETLFCDLSAHATGVDFRQFLKSNRRDSREKSYSAEYKRKMLGTIRSFFKWLHDEKSYTYTSIWISRFRLRLGSVKRNRNKRRYSFEEVVKIANTSVDSLVDERTRAACVFLFLSAMRIDAFTTLPIKSVDLRKKTVKQWPSYGVRTKLNKEAETSLLCIPRMFSVVEKWDKKVRNILPLDGMWFAPLTTTMPTKIDPYGKIGKSRDSGLRKDIERFLYKAGVEYKAAHAFRHGHIRFLRDNAKDYRGLEAIANNAMQNLSTMLNYGALTDQETQAEVIKLSKKSLDLDTTENMNIKNKVSQLIQELQDSFVILEGSM